MTARKKTLIIGSGILVMLLGWGWGAWILFNSNALEVALGMKHLPASVLNCHVCESAWTDYTVQAYFEISPQDLEKVVAARPYRHSKIPAFLDLRPLSGSKFPGVSEFTAAYRYDWDEQRTRCTVWTDHKKRKVFVVYASHIANK